MSNGGNTYGSANLPCELGSGAEGPNQSYGNVVGGGIIGKISNILTSVLSHKPQKY